MSYSISSSSRSASSSRPGFHGQNRSPVRYRVGPMDYEPPTPCECKHKPKATMWISWSDENPGRRYKTCAMSRMGGCNFYEWHDDPIEDCFLKQLLIDLRDKVRLLEMMNSELCRGAMAVQERQVVQVENHPAPVARLPVTARCGYWKNVALFVLVVALVWNSLFV
ncbi:uncharacterized protein LOC125554128 [Triticum urartu]|uniref:uncharacterized protein LOC125552655 n=1 Tax=Triticum urartu TaxID=4572 RepID=UPI002044B96C|nr:uncharacterized protein LOC125552655 [Triticum urartu]XP_048573690.1 uncharacterized protein LOC125554128 [Triticum urartu]